MSLSLLAGLLKAGTALAGAVWLALERHRPFAARVGSRRFRQGLLLLGLAALAGWSNYGLFHFTRYVHYHEGYHYYVGAKYHAEIGYTGLYQCTALAEAQLDGEAALHDRWIRNLRTNDLEPATRVLREGTAECPTRFTPARWLEFRHDIGWLKRQVRPERWRALLMDHGYNATPVWTMVGGALANLGPASRPSMLALSLIDPVLLLFMWWIVGRAFGWPAAAVALLWWGTNYPARFYYTGGAFLRSDWLVAIVAGICLAKRGRHLASGAALGAAASLRVFPLLFVLGVVLAEAARWIRTRRIAVAPEVLRFGAGFVLAVAVLVVGSSLANSGRWLDAADWKAFAGNSAKHLDSPATNNLGLKPLLAFRPSERSELLNQWWEKAPWDTWYAARRAAAERTRPVFLALVAGMVLLWWRAIAARPAWVVLALSTAMLPVTFELSSYYFAVFLLLALLWLERPLVGVLVAAAAALTWLPRLRWPDIELTYVGVNAIVLALSAAVLAIFAFRRRASETPEAVAAAAASDPPASSNGASPIL